MSTLNINQLVPARVLAAIQQGKLHKIGAARIGADELTLDKIAAHLGEKLAAQNFRNRVIAEGLLALAQLDR